MNATESLTKIEALHEELAAGYAKLLTHLEAENARIAAKLAEEERLEARAKELAQPGRFEQVFG